MFRETGKIVVAAFLGWLLTIGTLVAINSTLDRRLQSALSNYLEPAADTVDPVRSSLEQDFRHLVAAVGAEDLANSAGKTPVLNAEDSEHADRLLRALGQTMLYGSSETTGWLEGTFGGWWAPFLERRSVNSTVEELALVLLRECSEIAVKAGLQPKDMPPCEFLVTPELERLWIQQVGNDLGTVLEALQKKCSFQIRRYVNGPIQAITIWMMWSAIILLVVFWVPEVRSELAVLRDPTGLANGRDSPYPCDSTMRVFPSSEVILRPDTTCVQYRKWLQHLHAASGEKGSLDVLIQTLNGFLKSRTVDAAREAAQIRFEQLQDELDSRFEAVRYLAWAIPSLGFIGTVLGIGAAMFDADAIVSASTDRALQQSAIQKVTGQLGTAFDTTLVALVASLVLMAVYHACLRYGQVHMGQVYQLVTNRLIGRMGGASLEQIFRLLVKKAMLDSKLQEMEIGKEIVRAMQEQIDSELDNETEVQDLAGVVEEPDAGAPTGAGIGS